jgi:hypothetical protein
MQSWVKKSLVISVICILIVISFPTTNADVDYFNNSIVVLVGKCNTTGCGGIWWKFGLFVPLVRRNFFVIANNEKNESINVAIYSFQDGFATYIGHKDIIINLNRARGLFYWGGKALLVNHTDPPPLFIICRAKSVGVTT